MNNTSFLLCFVALFAGCSGGGGGGGGGDPLSTPNVPTLFAPTVVSESQLDLAWADVADEDGYQVDRSLDSTNWTPIAATASGVMAYSDVGLQPETQYFYRVRAFNSVGSSVDSNVVSGTTRPALPGVPLVFPPAYVTDTQIDLAWADSGNEDGYQIDRSPDGVGGWALIAAPDADVTEYSNIGLQPDTQYFYRVRAHNAAGMTANSDVIEARTLATITDPAVVAAIIQQAGAFVVEAPESTSETPLDNEISPNNPNIELVRVRHDDVQNIQDITYLGLNDDVLWPGSLIKGQSAGGSAHDFVYNPVTAPRAPVTLYINTSSYTGSDITVTIPNPIGSTVAQGISNLLAQADLSVPAIFQYSSEQIYSASQLSAFVNADVSTATVDLETAFTFSDFEEKTRICVSAKQIYYKIIMDTPVEPRLVFPADVDPVLLTSLMPPGSQPLYLSSVSYGWMAFTTVESDLSQSAVTAAVSAAYNGAITEINVDAGVTHEQVLSQSTVKTFVYGGSTLGLVGNDFNGVPGLLQVINASAQYDPETSVGVPLVYSFRRLYDNDQALITQTSQYTTVQEVRILQPVRVTAINYVPTDTQEADSDIEMDRLNLYARAYSNATTPTAFDEGYVFNWSTAGEVEVDSNEAFVCSAAGPSYTREFTFDLRGGNSFQNVRLEFVVGVRELDDVIFGTDEDYSDGTGTRFGSQFVNVPLSHGEHTIQTTGDFSGTFRFRLELFN